MAIYDLNKLTKLEALKTLAEKVNANFATKTELNELSNKVEEIVTAGGEPNKIEKIKVNGTEQTIGADKSVDIKMPVKVSELSNDSKFQTDTDVSSAVNNAINDFATEVSNDGVVNTFKELVDYCATHSSETAEMVGDIAKNTSAIEALESLVGDKAVATQITEAITEALKTGGADKYALATELASAVSRIGTNESTITAIQTKLNDIAEGATKVEKSDTNGNIKINGNEVVVYTAPDIATEKEVKEMLNEVFAEK